MVDVDVTAEHWVGTGGEEIGEFRDWERGGKRLDVRGEWEGGRLRVLLYPVVEENVSVSKRQKTLRTLKRSFLKMSSSEMSLQVEIRYKGLPAVLMRTDHLHI